MNLGNRGMIGFMEAWHGHLNLSLLVFLRREYKVFSLILIWEIIDMNSHILMKSVNKEILLPMGR